ncbi:hypothetical protein [Kitasatospora sp. KL5]|uniref:hypothetical protein n=1 Tax=Kitasatospora sp. KL5 TaxID=3425125 RepID=UPI003D6DAB7F
MDPYEELLALARCTAVALGGRGVAARHIEDDRGTSVDGWVVDRVADSDPAPYRGPGGRSGLRTGCELVLGTDGRLHTYRQRCEERPTPRGRAMVALGTELTPASPRTLARLGPGAPFDHAGLLLERLPWTALPHPVAEPKAIAAAPAPEPARPSWARRPDAPDPAPPPGPGRTMGMLIGLSLGTAGGACCALGCSVAGAPLLGDSAGPVGLAAAGLCLVAGAAAGGVWGRRGSVGVG